MSRIMIICLCGCKQSGKDTFADILVKEHGYVKIKFADAMKDVMKLLFSFTTEQLDGKDKEVIDHVWGITPRKMMQFFGTEMMQYKLSEILPDVGRTFWAKRLIATMSPGVNYVIADLRFNHELDLLKHNFDNVIVVRVTSVNNLNDDCHLSEQEFKQFKHDFQVRNNIQKDLADSAKCLLSHFT